MSVVNLQRDVQMRIERAQRESEIQAQRAQAEEDRKNEILKEHAHIASEFNAAKATAEANKTKMLELAKRFYNLDQDKAYEYASISHRPEASAVKHLIDEDLEGPEALGSKQFVVYECNFCKDKHYNLETFERHCYNNGHNHRDVNLKRIEDDYVEEIAKANKEMEKEIFLAAQAKNMAVLRAAAESRRAYEAKAKKDLPYVK